MNRAVEGFSVVILKESREEEKARVPETFMMADSMAMISSREISVFRVISLLTVDEYDMVPPCLFWFPRGYARIPRLFSSKLVQYSRFIISYVLSS